MDEFDLIEQLFAPLAGDGPPAFALTDDAAVWDPPAGRSVVATKDMMVAGTHFLPDDAPEQIAAKLLRVNLSDLAAMGAEPYGYLLGLKAGEGFSDDWVRRFAAGLAEDQRRFGCRLLGGDMVAGAGPMVLSLTALGLVAPGSHLGRAGARVGDTLVVSGTIGDAALGLDGLTGVLDADPALADRYRLPQPRLEVGRGLVGLAHACIDVSDGLVADVGHICAASGVGARIDRAAVPLSAAAARLVAADADLWTRVLTGGDDYELAFAVAADRLDAVAALARGAGVPLTPIGDIVATDTVEVVDEHGRPQALDGAGYRHF